MRRSLFYFCLSGAALLMPGSDFSAPIATVDGAPITRGAYADHLIEISGTKPLEDFVHAELLADELAALGAEDALAAAVDAAWEEERATMLLRTSGNAASLEDDLATIGFTLEGYRARFLAFKRVELMEDLIVLATRTVDPDALAARFELEYGEGGVKVEVRHLMMNRAQLKAGLVKQGTDPKTLDNATLDALIDERLRELRAELEAGADFETVARRESFDISVKGNGGLIPGYNYKHYGPAFADAVRAAEVGALVGPVTSSAAVHLFVVESRVTTALDDVRAELEALLLAEPVEFPERAALRARLFAEHEVVYPDATAPRR